MKRRIALVVSATSIAIVVFWALGFRLEPVRGEILAVHDGAPIYYQRGADMRGTYGLEFECVEFVNRWLVSHGYRNLTQTGHALSYLESASAKGLMAYPNGGSEPPRWGDVIVFSSSRQPNGHVGVVVAVGPRGIWVAQQNATLRLGPIVRPLPYEWLPLRHQGDRWLVRSRWPLTCLGWSRAPL